ncbi:MAG: MBL fold metallo-hydrolase [Sandaracinaceae bacterium]
MPRIRWMVSLLVLAVGCGGASAGSGPGTRDATAAVTCRPVDTSTPLAVTRAEGPDVVVHTLTAPANSAWVTSHIIETPNRLILIDAQLYRGYAQALRRYVDGLDKPLDRVVITHGHPDHYLGLEFFPDAPHYALPETQADIRQRQRFHIRMHRVGEAECDAVAERAVIPEHAMEEGPYTLDGVRVEFERAYNAEDNDQLVVRVPTAGVLILQDLVAHDVHAWTATGMIPHWIEVLRGYEDEADVRHVLAGHGAPGGPEVIREMIGYLERAQPIHEAELQPDAFRQAFQTEWPSYDMYIINLMAATLE